MEINLNSSGSNKLIRGHLALKRHLARWKLMKSFRIFTREKFPLNLNSHSGYDPVDSTPCAESAEKILLRIRWEDW